MLDAINAERAANGLAALQPDQTLTQIARMRSDDMLRRGYFDHYTPEGTTVFDMLAEYGVPYAHAGENLAFDTYPASESVSIAMQALMTSPSHRANILNADYTLIGVGLATDASGVHYYTMVFVG